MPHPSHTGTDRELHHIGRVMTGTVVRTFHPLDPLGPDEFRQVAAIVRRERGVDDRWRFASIELVEPDKQQLAEYDATGTAPERRALVVCWHRDSNSTYKAT